MRSPRGRMAAVSFLYSKTLNLLENENHNQIHLLLPEGHPTAFALTKSILRAEFPANRMR